MAFEISDGSKISVHLPQKFLAKLQTNDNRTKTEKFVFESTQFLHLLSREYFNGGEYHASDSLLLSFVSTCKIGGGKWSTDLNAFTDWKFWQRLVQCALTTNVESERITFSTFCHTWDIKVVVCDVLDDCVVVDDDDTVGKTTTLAWWNNLLLSS